jgi:hypothetical protein
VGSPWQGPGDERTARPRHRGLAQSPASLVCGPRSLGVDTLTLWAEHAEDLGRLGAGAAEPVRDASVEVHDLGLGLGVAGSAVLLLDADDDQLAFEAGAPSRVLEVNSMPLSVDVDAETPWTSIAARKAAGTIGPVTTRERIRQIVVTVGRCRPCRCRCACRVWAPASSPPSVSCARSARTASMVPGGGAMRVRDVDRVDFFSTACQPPARLRATSMPTHTWRSRSVGDESRQRRAPGRDSGVRTGSAPAVRS